MNKKFSMVFMSFVLFLSLSSVGQNISPSVQQKIDSLQTWMKQEIALKGTVDTVELRRWNERIREEQDRVKNDPDQLKLNEEDPKETRVIKFSGYIGASFTVPQGKKWKVKKLTVSSGMGEYNILVRSVTLKEEYTAGDIINTPGFTAEAALLTEDQSNVLYIYEIIEVDLN